MPKHKTKKALTKRVRRTGTGKLLRMKGGKSHLATSKSRKRKRHLRKPTVVHSTFANKLAPLMGK